MVIANTNAPTMSDSLRVLRLSWLLATNAAMPVKQNEKTFTGMMPSPAAGAVLMTVSTVVVAINASLPKVKR